VNPLLSKLIAPIKQFFHREDWKNLVVGWGVLFAIFVLPWILGYWYPKAFGFGSMTFLLLIIGLIFSFYLETKRKIEVGEPTHKVTKVIFKSMELIGDVGSRVAVAFGEIFTAIFGVILLVALIGGVIGILVFGWKQLL